MTYTFLEHTADIRMRVTGKTLEELFQDSLLGMVAAMKPIEPQEPIKIQREISIESHDTTALLIDFLSEALVFIHTKHEAYTEIKFHKLTNEFLEVELIGYKSERFTEDIKAVTYHEANIHKTESGLWSTNIIFDI